MTRPLLFGGPGPILQTQQGCLTMCMSEQAGLLSLQGSANTTALKARIAVSQRNELDVVLRLCVEVTASVNSITWTRCMIHESG